MDHAETTRALFAALNSGDLDGFIASMADDMVEHEQAPGLEPTKEGVAQFFRMWTAAFPDLRMEPQDVVADGDRVAVRLRITGTHQGDFMGMPASGRGIDVGAIDIMRFGDDGLVHEHWGVSDALTMMQQLGAIPAGPPA